MMRPYMTTPDKAEVLFSEIQEINGKPQVRIYVEKWSDAHRDFDSLEMYLPEGNITQRVGFSDVEANGYRQHIMHLKDDIWDSAEEALQEEGEE